MKHFALRPGHRHPFGATVHEHGVNFSIWGLNATAVELLLYEKAESPRPFQVIRLDPEVNRTLYAWHVFVEGLEAGCLYGWRMDGPTNTSRTGFRFDKEKVLLDPWARAVTDKVWNRKHASEPGDNSASSLRAILTDNDPYDWEGDVPLNHPLEETVIYELHVGGFTRHPSAGVPHPGTFAGLIAKIPYLKHLGITDVELMPVMAFDEQDVPPGAATQRLRNYWGYSTHSFFSPHPRYCTSAEQGTHVREFRDLVKALHRAGIGVIMDVVFNHTAEAGEDGPTINFKGMGNAGFYHLDPDDRRLYRDFTGCGNTVNCSYPVVSRFLVDCLEYWVRDMHVDGFRFDLASVMVRDRDGIAQYYAPTPWNIEFSTVLASSTLIAEAWDAGGLYQVGGFPGFRWAEWNGRYRDIIRRFVRGDRGIAGEVATRLTGSSDLYAPSGRLPTNSINFITCHDGFTLQDLVSYDAKHNEANGDHNRDGSDDNLSWNCGCEGETADPQIRDLRSRQAKNCMALLLLSVGVPMILAGDEVLRTQQGNNNCYCQDNELSWFDWSLPKKNREMLRFVSGMIRFRRRHRLLMRRRFLTGTSLGPRGLPDVSWHGLRLHEPPWDDPESQVLAYTLAAPEQAEEDLHVILNMSETLRELPLPRLGGRCWYRAVDTAEASPGDISEPKDQCPVTAFTYRAGPRSVVVLEGR